MVNTRDIHGGRYKSEGSYENKNKAEKIIIAAGAGLDDISR